MMPSPTRTLILADGGTESLLACAFVREKLTGAGVVAGDSTASNAPLVLPFSTNLTDRRVDAILRHAEIFAMRVIECMPDLPVDLARGAMEEEAHRLLAATYLGARMGCEEVLWPTSAPAGDSIHLERAAAINDLALLVSRLAAIGASEHGVPCIRVSVPYSQLTDAQITDLVMDMDLPVQTCCWWGLGDDEAARWKQLAVVAC